MINPETIAKVDANEPHYDNKVWKKNPMPVDYTCGCGLYVHPKHKNPNAIHIDDCPYAEKQEERW